MFPAVFEPMFRGPGCMFPGPRVFNESSLFPAVLGPMFPVPGGFWANVPCSREPHSESHSYAILTTFVSKAFTINF